MKPEQIERLSFQIIDQEAGCHNFSPAQWSILRRMIHTTADFEYKDTARIHPKAIAAGVRAIKAGNTIITDTNMVKAGIRARELRRFGGSVKCYVDDPTVAETASRDGITRAQVAVDAATVEMQDGIYVIGNAPTALLRLIDLIKAKSACPALVIGVPVGFVNAVESKAALIALDYPYISNVGRKGGSNVAASVVNALIQLALAES